MTTHTSPAPSRWRLLHPIRRMPAALRQQAHAIVTLLLLTALIALLGIGVRADLWIGGLAGLTAALTFLLRRFDRAERDAALAELRVSEQRYRAVIDSQAELIVRVDPLTLTITFVNEAYCRHRGQTADQLIGQPLLASMHPRNAETVRGHLDALFASGGQYQHEDRNYDSHGHERWMQWHDRPIHDATGRIIEIQSVGRDVTARRQMEDRLRMTEQRYQSLLESKREIIMRWKPDLTITFANDAYCRYMELPLDQIVGRSLLDVVHPAEIPFIRAYHAEVMAGKSTYYHEAPYYSRSGQVYWMAWSDYPIYNSAGDLIEYQSFGRDITERKRAEDALRDSQAQLEALVNDLDAIIWEIDAASSQTLFISRSAERLLGFSVDTFLNQPQFWRSRIHPDDRADVIDRANRYFRERDSYQIEYRMQTADGRVVWLRDLATVLRRSDQPAIVRGVSIDITAMKAMQNAEREQRIFAEALRDTIAATTSTLDLDEVLDRILEQIGRVLPGSARDVLLIDGDRVRLARAAGYEAYNDVMSIQTFNFRIDDVPNFRYMRDTGQPKCIDDIWHDPGWTPEPNGGGRWKRSYVGAPIRLKGSTIGFINVNGDQPGAFDATDAAYLAAFADQVAGAIRNARLYAAVRDDADRLEELVHQRTEELRVERERLQAILDFSGEGILYTEGDGIRFANRTVTQLSGYAPDELVGMEAENLTHILDPDYLFQILPVIGDTLRAGQVWRAGDARLRRKDGTIFDAGLTISAVGEPDGDNFRTVTIIRDISRQKQLEAQRSAFVAHASHELRTPLTNMKTRLYLLRKMPDKLLEHVTVLEQVTDWMQHLIEDLLDMTRYERGMTPMRLTGLDVRELVEKVFAAQQQEADRKGMTYTLTLPHTPVTVNADADRLMQVLINLLSNAINYTPDGGAIAVTSETTPTTALIHVTDTGIGISADNLSQIFQPFFRVASHVEGTGLGLSISREIVEQHGGTLTVTSTLGRGSTFTITLPLTETAPGMG